MWSATALLIHLNGAALAGAQWSDGWLVQSESHVCALTRHVNDDEGRFHVALNDTALPGGTAIVIYSKAWARPERARLPHIALKAGSVVMSESALAISSTGAFGNGLSFRLDIHPSEVARLLLEQELVIWDARGPRKLFTLDLRASETALQSWRACGIQLRANRQTDPFRAQ